MLSIRITTVLPDRGINHEMKKHSNFSFLMSAKRFFFFCGYCHSIFGAMFVTTVTIIGINCFILLNVSIFCFIILSWNLCSRFIHLLRRFMHSLTFTVSKTSSISRYAAFPVAMLYNLSLSVWLNGFIISYRRFITACRRYCNTSLFLFWSSILTNDDIIVV